MGRTSAPKRQRRHLANAARWASSERWVFDLAAIFTGICTPFSRTRAVERVAGAKDCCQSTAVTDEHRLDLRREAAEVGQGICLNCGAPLTGAFCSVCGQRDIPPYPTTRELVVDAVTEFSGWDGRLATTLRSLVRRPGLLTLEFLEGRRARYISPLRLYLTASLIYFLLAASAPRLRRESGKSLFPGLRVETTVSDSQVSRPERVANAASESLDNQELTPAEKQAVLTDIAKAPAVMQPFLRRAVEDPSGFKRGIFENMPRLLFVLLPIFAAIVAIFYRRRKYPEHLYFGIHLYAFIFLALAVTELAKFTRLPLLAMVASALAMVAIPIYATLAFRRVYGGSVVATVMKELAIGLIYGSVAIAAFIVMVYWVSISG